VCIGGMPCSVQDAATSTPLVCAAAARVRAAKHACVAPVEFGIFTAVVGALALETTQPANHHHHHHRTNHNYAQDGSNSSMVQLMGVWGDLSRRLQQHIEPEDDRSGGSHSSESSSSHQQLTHTAHDHSRHREQQHHQQHHHHQQQQDDEPQADRHLSGLVLEALKMALRCSASQPPRRDGRTPAERAVGLAAALADLAAAGAPLDAPCIAASIVADAVDLRLLHPRSVEAALGSEVAALVSDMLAVRHAPERVELYDDEAAR